MSHSSLYESVFNRGPEGNCLVSPSPEATIIAVNDALLRLSGRQRIDFIGVSLFEAFPDNPDDPDKSAVAALRNSISMAIETGKAQAMRTQRYPIRMTLLNGESVFEERYWSAVNTPVFNDDGELVCISHSTMDVTDQFRSETALRQSEERMRAFITATSDVVYRMSPDWKNMHRLDGRGFLKTTTDFAEYRIEEYVHPADLQLARDAIAAAIRDKTVFALEHRVVRADQSPGWTYSRAIPMLDEHGEIHEWIGTASDITERKHTEERLTDADRRKDEFLAMLAHELRNPLAPISSAAQLLTLPNLDKSRVRQTSEIMIRQVRHMTSLIDDLLDVSRVTRGTVELDNAVLDIRLVVVEAVEQATPLLQSRSHQLTLQLAPEVTAVMGDKKRLIQVVANLVNNAAKYTPEGGNITLRTEIRDGRVVLEVSDDGIGIEAHMLDRIFDLFAQAEVSSARSSGGLGLGLALVRSIVELHRGMVRCESAGIGKGSKFTVCLPLLAERVDVADIQPALTRPQGNAQPLRVLVVDDNVDAAEMLSILLEADGHQVLVEHNPKTALVQAHASTPDGYLLDIGLPEMDGYELARRIRAQPAGMKAVLVAVTGYGQDFDRQLSLDAGFDHHLVKPVDMAELNAILAGATPLYR